MPRGVNAKGKGGAGGLEGKEEGRGGEDKEEVHVLALPQGVKVEEGLPHHSRVRHMVGAACKAAAVIA